VDLGGLHGGEWVLDRNDVFRYWALKVSELLALLINFLAGSAVDDKGSEDGDPE
jgi:hypothetical protein